MRHRALERKNSAGTQCPSPELDRPNRQPAGLLGSQPQVVKRLETGRRIPGLAAQGLEAGGLHEREADAVADRVTRDGPEQRQECEHRDGTSPQRQADAADRVGAAGEPLDREVRAELEPRFGHDFSRVRVHADAAAATRAEALGAEAFTVGEDMYFGNGQYAPASAGGKHLLAHELTHVLQQRAGSGAAGMGARSEGAVDASAHGPGVQCHFAAKPAPLWGKGRSQVGFNSHADVVFTQGGKKGVVSSWYDATTQYAELQVPRDCTGTVTIFNDMWVDYDSDPGKPLSREIVPTSCTLPFSVDAEGKLAFLCPKPTATFSGGRPDLYEPAALAEDATSTGAMGSVGMVSQITAKETSTKTDSEGTKLGTGSELGGKVGLPLVAEGALKILFSAEKSWEKSTAKGTGGSAVIGDKRGVTLKVAESPPASGAGPTVHFGVDQHTLAKMVETDIPAVKSWWLLLPPDTRQQIYRGEAIIRLIAKASAPGTQAHNHTLAHRRAEAVRGLLEETDGFLRGKDCFQVINLGEVGAKGPEEVEDRVVTMSLMRDPRAVKK